MDRKQSDFDNLSEKYGIRFLCSNTADPHGFWESSPVDDIFFCPADSILGAPADHIFFLFFF